MLSVSISSTLCPSAARTVKDGTIDLSKLPTGAMVVEELECPGYVIDDFQRIIELKPNEHPSQIFAAGPVIFDDPEGGLGLVDHGEHRVVLAGGGVGVDVDAQNKASLQGAVFRFEQIDGDYTTTGITGFDGTISFQGDELPLV